MSQLIDMNGEFAQAEYQRRMSLAQALRESSMSPMGGVAGGIVVPVSPLEGIGRLAAALGARRQEKKANEGIRQYAAQKQQRLAQTLAGIGNLRTPEDYQRVGVSLIADPDTRELGTKLMMTGAERAQQAALISQFYPQGGPNQMSGVQTMPNMGGGPPVEQVSPNMPGMQTMPNTGGGAPTDRVGPGMPGMQTMPNAGQGAPQSLPQSGFDMGRYIAMISSGNPALIKAAEAEREAFQVPASTIATIAAEERRRQGLSAAESAADKDRDAAREIDALRVYHETGMWPRGYGGPQAGVSAPPSAAPASPPTGQIIPRIDPSLPPKVRNDLAAKAAEAEIENDKKLAASRPKAWASLRAYQDQNTVVLSAIDEALGMVNNWTAGAGAALKIGPTEARYLSGLLDTIKGNIGFDKLAEMRANSPTGGALGDVAGKELIALQATLGALEQENKPELLKKQLTTIRERVAGSRKRMVDAFSQTYGYGMPEMEISPNQPGNDVVDWNALPHGR